MSENQRTLHKRTPHNKKTIVRRAAQYNIIFATVRSLKHRRNPMSMFQWTIAHSFQQTAEKLVWHGGNSMVRASRCISRRMLKKASLLTRPTPAVISPARPESAKTDSSPWDAPNPKQGRGE